ncbi:Spx/MgsR family RNA polymerase-binding regulatory protein [Daejeonella sp.]|uniref:Spx/MgsR family RNA polymerase-binding regulatory protein n=1 Tax=Daejeonella sp. TaxID=2805397 RepID=UPI0027209417|nr:Spx/MgsR family RNA polymerase-binding regulatory protein [Daejeonella sp.]MDO8994729.1 Spx/MgsR family RNA polymerase-binding regulatory protein [Daejeonella sp.]MDP2414636.1 Spx/MgsR family RNA polymerase-binding regulatory protein [Daejeonella sp.]
MKIYGIPNCNTVKKTLDWFKLHKIDFEFHDFKKLGVDRPKLEEWSKQLGWEALLNKRGTTWKMLSPEIQNSITSKDSAFKLMQEKVSVIKRPVIETGSDSVLLGFNEEQLGKLLIKLKRNIK